MHADGAERRLLTQKRGKVSPKQAAGYLSYELERKSHGLMACLDVTPPLLLPGLRAA
jgi:hypothetical protein